MNLDQFCDTIASKKQIDQSVDYFGTLHVPRLRAVCWQPLWFGDKCRLSGLSRGRVYSSPEDPRSCSTAFTSLSTCLAFVPAWPLHLVSTWLTRCLSGPSPTRNACGSTGYKKSGCDSRVYCSMVANQMWRPPNAHSAALNQYSEVVIFAFTLCQTHCEYTYIEQKKRSILRDFNTQTRRVYSLMAATSVISTDDSNHDTIMGCKSQKCNHQTGPQSTVCSRWDKKQSTLLWKFDAVGQFLLNF